MPQTEEAPTGRSWPRWIAKFVCFTILIYAVLTFACDPVPRVLP